MKTNTNILRLAASAACALPFSAFAGQTMAEPIVTPPPANAWEFRIEPYGWLTAIDGTSGPSMSPAEIDASFSDIFDVLEMAAALQFEARNGRWGIIGDAFYAKLGTDGTVTQELEKIDYDVDFKQFIGEFELFYRVTDQPQGFFDVYGGFRYNSLSLDLDVKRTGPETETKDDFSADRDWIDPIVGVRGQWNINERWYLAGKGDIGGFGVSSDFTWNLQGTVGYQFNERYSAEVGYRYFDTDYEHSGFTYDMAQSGLILGLNIRF